MDENPYLPPAELEPRTVPDGRPHLGAVVRDVTIIFVLTFLGGLCVGIFAARWTVTALQFALGIALANIVFSIVGFAISGCLAHEPRWRHLVHVAIGVWLASLINVMFFGATILNWVTSSLLIVILMGIGGGVSYVFRPARQQFS
jgi:hypothetical protein